MSPAPAGTKPGWYDRADGAVAVAAGALLAAVAALTVLSWKDLKTDASFVILVLVFGLGVGTVNGRRRSADHPGAAWLMPRARLTLLILAVVALLAGLALCVAPYPKFNVHAHFTRTGK